MTAASARAVTYSAVAALALLTAASAAPARPSAPRARSASVPPWVQPPAGLPRLRPVVVQPHTATDTVVVAGRIASNLYTALDSCAAATFAQRTRWGLAWSIADIFEYRIDMSRDLRVGDSFRALVERISLPDGSERVGSVLAVRFVLSQDTMTAIRFVGHGTLAPGVPTAAGYYDLRGRSLRAAFLRAPLEFRRISSGFGMRKHPILGIWRSHKGTDYVAAFGTPVRAIGDGVVTFAGWRGGYGNLVELRHRNGYVTRYGHLSRFARGTRPGARVTIGKTIAYVGMTGLATAPHLHFEVLVGGVQRDPRRALRDRGAGDPIPAGERDAFQRRATTLLAAMTGQERSTPPIAAR